ncbi:MAG TPA: carboxypeptidase-like regulatory domain-containing protein [Planctomycetota bacterium]|nr:carboxypeptidase-like regulatory domain-containing protein [Planctomycetota bacterium]
MRRLAIALSVCAVLRAAAAEAPADEAAGGIRGVVVDPEGAPVAGATVFAEFGHVGRGRGCFPQGIRDGEARTKTDRAGAFVLATPASASWAVVNVDAIDWVEPDPRVATFRWGTEVIRVPRGEAWRHVASPPSAGDCEGIPADARAMGLLAGEAWPRMRIVLERGEKIEGAVLSGAGAAVPGAAITVRWQDALPGWRTLEARGDARGRFSIRTPAPARITAAPVETVGNGRDPQAWAWPVRPGTSDLRLVLQERVALDLHVRNSPIPLQFARVGATPAGFPAPCDRVAGRLSREAGGDVLRLTGLLPGISDLVIHPPGANYVSAHARVAAPGEPVVIEWPLMIPVDGILEGEDVDDFGITWTGDAPTDGTTVVRIGTTAWPPGRLLVDPLGRFRLYAAGPGAICARRAGDPRCAWAPAFDPSRGFLRLPLATGREIRGSVEGRPGMRLSALRVRAVAGALSESAAVNDDGRFAIVGLPPVAFRVELRSGEWVHEAIDSVPAGAGGVRLHVRLPATEPRDGP